MILVLSLLSEAEYLPCFEVSPPAPTDSFVERHPSAENPADPASLDSPTDGYDTFPEQQLNRNQSEAELTVKREREEEPDENAAPLDSAHTFVTEEGDGQLWSSDLCTDVVDPSFSYGGQQFEPIPPVLQCQSGLHSEEPRIQSVGESHSVVVSAVLVKRRARTFGCKRPPPDEARNAVCQSNSADQCSIPGQSQHQGIGPAPHAKNPGEGSTPPCAAATSFCGQGRSSLGLARRMRTLWRPGVGEKRFSCTYCSKSFTRFSQLKEHLRCHTGEKPFSCLQCGRRFTKQCNLIRHAVVHSGEKPYECSLCGKCFTQRSSLKSHQKTAHWVCRAMPVISNFKERSLIFKRTHILEAVIGGWNCWFFFLLYVLVFKTVSFYNTQYNIDWLIWNSKSIKGHVNVVFKYISYFSCHSRPLLLTIFYCTVWKIVHGSMCCNTWHWMHHLQCGTSLQFLTVKNAYTEFYWWPSETLKCVI